MKNLPLSLVILSTFIFLSAIHAQEAPSAASSAEAAKLAKSDADTEKKAAGWVDSLSLADAEKAARVKAVIATHLKAVRDWHNSHPYTAVPESDPATGKTLTSLDRQMIADGAMPKTVHEALMAGLRKDLSAEQVEAVLDKYTEGKVAFTMKGYKAIVPDLTAEEEAKILGFLKEAREQAVDYKSIKQISAVFEIYKTKSEQYLNSNGRSWKALYKAYTDKIKAEKAAKAAAAAKKQSE
ncbi:MAG: DUF3826 domain-containing protein [Nibricoccus sp.]